MSSDPATPVRQELAAGNGLWTSVEITGGRARYEVRTTNRLYGERLEHMGYLPHGVGRFVRDLSASGDVLAIHVNYAHHLEEMIRQSARLATVRWEQALEVFLDRSAGSGLDWFLYGSGALALRGIDVDPGDLDFHVGDAYLAGQLFADLLVEPVTEMTGWIAERGGRAFNGCLFEWLSGVHPDIDRPTPHEQGHTAASRLEVAYWRGRRIPVAPLDLQLAVARQRGQDDRVARITRHLLTP